jgi:hypothetical protein
MQFHLVGARFRPVEAQSILLEAEVGDPVQLEPEPTNAYDPNAIKVIYKEHHVGYVPRETTHMIDLDLSYAFTALNGLSATIAAE